MRSIDLGLLENLVGKLTLDNLALKYENERLAAENAELMSRVERGDEPGDAMGVEGHQGT